jgi:hypothetical protein
MRKKIIKRVLISTWAFVTVVLLASFISTRAKLLEARWLLADQFRLLAHLESWVAKGNMTSFNEWIKNEQSLLLQYILWYEVKSDEVSYGLPKFLENPDSGLTEEQKKQVADLLLKVEEFLDRSEPNCERFEFNGLTRALPLFINAKRWENTPKARRVVSRYAHEMYLELFKDDPDYFVFPPLESNGCLQVRGAEASTTNAPVLQRPE